MKPNVKDFPWGKIVKIHEIGEYMILEYHPRITVGCVVTNDLTDATEFHPYINGKDTNTSYKSLDHAMVGAIAIKHEGGNTRADVYFCRMIGIK